MGSLQNTVYMWICIKQAGSPSLSLLSYGDRVRAPYENLLRECCTVSKIYMSCFPPRWKEWYEEVSWRANFISFLRWFSTNNSHASSFHVLGHLWCCHLHIRDYWHQHQSLDSTYRALTWIWAAKLRVQCHYQQHTIFTQSSQFLDKV